MMNAEHKERDVRHPVLLRAELKNGAGDTSAVLVENFSISGCCVRHYLCAGELVSINLPRMGRFEAEVRWGRLGRADLKFRRSH